MSRCPRALVLAGSLALVVSLASCGPDSFTVFGYHTWWTGDAWQAYDLAAIDELVYFELNVGPEGTLQQTYGWPERWQPMVEQAHAAGTAVVPTLTVADHAAFVAVFSSEERRERLLQETVAAVRAAGADGVHVDMEVFEPVPAAVRASYAAFVQDLKRTLGSESVVSVFTLAFDAPDVYDEHALARAADFLVVQGYDLHWMGGDTAGPTAALRGWGALNWEEILARYEDLGVPRRKLLMAVPFYGYEWPTTGPEPGAATRGTGQIISYAPVAERVPEVPVAAEVRAAEHGVRRDPASGSPYYAFRDSTGWHQGWFDDAASLRAKFDWVKAEKLGGVAVFPLGYDGGRFAEVLHEAFPPELRRRRLLLTSDAPALASRGAGGRVE